MAFDLGAMLANVSDSDTGHEQIQYIDLSLLDNDPNNFYALSDLPELANNIATCGLQQPIRVRRNPDADGRYIIVSGHRRRAALEILVKEDTVKWSEAPCIVERDDVSPSLQQLRLIYANAHTRKLTPAEVSAQAEQVEKLLYQLKEEGYEFPGRMRDHVAKAVGESKSKLARLKVIRENLIPMWQPAFKDGVIGESVAYALAQLNPEWQNIMYNAWGGMPRRLYEGHVRGVSARLEKISNVDCRAYKGTKCHIQPARQAHIAKLGQYDDWNCNGCCLDCSLLADCSSSCSAASMKKARLIENRKVERQAAKSAELEKMAPTLDLIRGVYSRWWEVLTARNMSAESYLHACGMRYIGDDAKDFERRAKNLKCINKTAIKLPFPTNIWESDAKFLVAAADVLGCTIDWLLGRDVPGPFDTPEEAAPADPAAAASVVWQTGKPKAPGTYIAMTAYFGDESPRAEELEWDDVLGWMDCGDVAEEVGIKVLCWTEKPDPRKITNA